MSDRNPITLDEMAGAAHAEAMRIPITQQALVDAGLRTEADPAQVRLGETFGALVTLVAIIKGDDGLRNRIRELVVARRKAEAKPKTETDAT